MVIKRDGVEIELTREELVSAYFEEKRNGAAEELTYWLDVAIDEGEISKEDADTVDAHEYVEEYLNMIENNDSINEHINEMTYDFVLKKIVR